MIQILQMDGEEDAGLYTLARQEAYLIDKGIRPFVGMIQTARGYLLFQRIPNGVRVLVFSQNWVVGMLPGPSDISNALPVGFPGTSTSQSAPSVGALKNWTFQRDVAGFTNLHEILSPKGEYIGSLNATTTGYTNGSTIVYGDSATLLYYDGAKTYTAIRPRTYTPTGVYVGQPTLVFRLPRITFSTNACTYSESLGWGATLTYSSATINYALVECPQSTGGNSIFVLSASKGLSEIKLAASVRSAYSATMSWIFGTAPIVSPATISNTSPLACTTPSGATIYGAYTSLSADASWTQTPGVIYDPYSAKFVGVPTSDAISLTWRATDGTETAIGDLPSMSGTLDASNGSITSRTGSHITNYYLIPNINSRDVRLICQINSAWQIQTITPDGAATAPQALADDTVITSTGAPICAIGDIIMSGYVATLPAIMLSGSVTMYPTFYDTKNLVAIDTPPQTSRVVALIYNSNGTFGLVQDNGDVLVYAGSKWTTRASGGSAPSGYLFSLQ